MGEYTFSNPLDEGKKSNELVPATIKKGSTNASAQVKRLTCSLPAAHEWFLLPDLLQQQQQQQQQQVIEGIASWVYKQLTFLHRASNVFKMCQQQEQRKQTQSPAQGAVANASSNSSSTPGPSASSAPSRSPSAGYVLYLHRQELRRKAPSSRSSITKIHLTSELIARTKKNISKCSSEDLEILARETLFKKHLQRHVHYRKMQMHAWLMAKRQKQLQKTK